MSILNSGMGHRPLWASSRNLLSLTLAVGGFVICGFLWFQVRDHFDVRFVFLFLVPPILINSAFDGLLGGFVAAGLGLVLGLAILGTNGLDLGDALVAGGYAALGAVNSLLGHRLHATVRRADRAAAQVKSRDARLQELQAELAHVSRVAAMGEMATTLAHEMNQPLSAISNYLQGCESLLASNPVDQLKLEQGLKKAEEQVDRASEVVVSLRSFLAKGDAVPKPQDLSLLIEEAAALALLGHQNGQVKVVFEIDRGLPRVSVEKLQIQQVVVNLVRNAIDAMSDEPDKKITISVRRSDAEHVVVGVEDCGHGFDKTTAQNLFSPFFTTKRDGLGIGLSICKKIIEAHGGQLWAETGERGGAVFRFTLPLNPRRPLRTEND